MAGKKERSHEVTIRVRFDAPVTAKEARYAVWNNFHGHVMWGGGKPRRNDDYRDPEPFDKATVTVRR